MGLVGDFLTVPTGIPRSPDRPSIVFQRMNSAWHPVIREIHAGAAKVVLATTGGGSRAIAALLSTPGASRTMIEARIPYAAEALAKWLGASPEQFCSDATARMMAMRAYLDARSLMPSGDRLVGVGCTASLASDRPKRGPHRAWIAVQTDRLTRAVSIEFTHAARQAGDSASGSLAQRDAEEDLVAAAIINELAQAASAASRIEMRLPEGDCRRVNECAAPPQWRELLAGKRDAVSVIADAHALVDRSTAANRSTVAPPPAIFPGAFHPLHAGHERIAALAAARLGQPVGFEISIFNVDKPPLDFIEIERRVGQFASLSPPPNLWLTRAPTFLEKAKLFPGATFIVGIDTLLRIAEPNYYGGSGDCRAALEQIASLGCRFLVFGRVVQGCFQSLDDVALPQTLRAVCDAIPESDFRNDISSTALRRQALADADQTASESP